MPRNLPLIPYPQHVSLEEGCFTVSLATSIWSQSGVADDAILWFQSIFHTQSGVRLKRLQEPYPGDIRLVYDAELPAEGYSLRVAPTGVAIKASTSAGFLYALVSLLQLVPLNSPVKPGEWEVRAVDIHDQPRFGWRGLLLDSSRYFQPVDWIKRFIDLMALHKYNVLHWHLTDDQGWRVEIDRFPKLTTVSAWRRETRTGHEMDATPDRFDGKPHGGFYTKLQLREIVAYAKARCVTIVPEIEMPGHAQDVLAAYPHLSCTGEPFDVSTQWGIHKEVFCAGNDDVLRFLESVIDEVLEIFPSEFIHIGADECVKTRWEECPKCQHRIAEHGLADEHELQSWIVRHFDAYLGERGRRLIGYDEILEGGLAQNAAVVSWRSEAGGITAARAGHEVVMMPNQKTYFDYYQSPDHDREPLCIGGDLSLPTVYGYEPMPDALTADEAKFILGGQGALWTEYMPRPDSIEYMAFPRVCALAERLWSPADTRDYGNFVKRLKSHLRLLDRFQVNYRKLGAEEGW